MATAAERPRRWVVVGLCVVAVVPMVTALVVLARSPWWMPGGDEALIGLHGWEVGSPSASLGPYSRFGWSHPGPVLFWALVVPIHLVGDAGHGAAVGAVLVNAAAAVAAVWLVSRRSGVVAAAGLVGLVAVLGVTNPDGVWSVWNPYVTLLPFLACVVALWSVAEGDLGAVPVAGLTGLFCIESHVGYASVLGAMAVVAGALGAVGWWRRGRPVPGRRAVVLLATTAVASAVAVWPVVRDQLEGTGNLGRMVDYLASSGRPTVGPGAALGQLARQLAPWGPWAGGREPSSIFGGGALPAPSWWLAVPLVAVGLATGAAWHRRDATMRRLLGIVVVGCLAGVWSVASITPPAYAYLLVWLHVLAAVLWGAVVLTAGRALVPVVVRDRRPLHADGPSGPRAGRLDARSRVAAAVAVVVLATVPVGLAVVSVARSQPPNPEAARAAGELLPAALMAVAPGAAFSISSDAPYTRVVETLGVELVEQGRRIVVDADHALAWGREREGDIDDPGVVRLGVVVGTGAAPATVPDGWTVLAQWAPAAADPPGDPVPPMSLVVRRGG